MKIQTEKYIVEQGEKLHLDKRDTSWQGEKPDIAEVDSLFQEEVKKIDELQYAMYAENRQSLLVVMQGMDAAGKDGLIRHLMSGVNPQGVIVSSFKHPSSHDLDHDYLWRHYSKLPERGQIGIFNRSHYENVLITRVHPELILSERLPEISSVEDISEKFWQKRFEQIRSFEQIISQNGTRVIKFFLHISPDEQKKRFLKRIDRADKHWKFSGGDIRERSFWKEYRKAYEDMLPTTSTKLCPWYILPADSKWYTRLLAAHIIRSTLEDMNPRFPSVSDADRAEMEQARETLMKG